MIVPGLARRLLAQAAVTDGQFGVDRQIWPGSAPQVETYPRVILNKISGSEDTHQGGATNLGQARIQVTAFARTYSGAANALKNCVTALNGLRDITLPNSVVMHQCDMEEGSESEFTNQPKDAGEKPVFQHSADFQVSYVT